MTLYCFHRPRVLSHSQQTTLYFNLLRTQTCNVQRPLHVNVSSSVYSRPLLGTLPIHEKSWHTVGALKNEASNPTRDTDKLCRNFLPVVYQPTKG